MCNSIFRNILPALFVLLVLAAMLGCEKEGTIKIINRTSFPVYAGIGSERYTVQSGAGQNIYVKTPASSIFNPDVEKKVVLDLVGETYMIYDSYQEAYVEQTTLKVNPGKTTKVYVDPNLASVKVRNLSDSLITEVIVERHEPLNTFTNNYPMELAQSAEWYKPITPATVSNQFYLIVRVVFSGGTEFRYGNAQTIMEKDEQFLITVQAPGKK